MTAVTESVTGRLRDVFRDAGAVGSLLAVDLQTGRSVCVDPDVVWPSASVFKLPVLVAYAVAVEEGRIDPRARLVVEPDQHVLGSTGLSVAADAVELSHEDLARLMISVSDNTAADLVLALVTKEAVQQVLTRAGAVATAVVHSCDELLRSMVDELGDLLEEMGHFGGLPRERVDRLTAIDAARTNRTTARDAVRLLSALWRDEVFPPASCARARDALALQVWPHRLAAATPPGARYSGKTGTLPGHRHDVGVFDLATGASVAVAVLTRADDYQDNRPDVDTAIGRAASMALAALGHG